MGLCASLFCVQFGLVCSTVIFCLLMLLLDGFEIPNCVGLKYGSSVYHLVSQCSNAALLNETYRLCLFVT